MRGVHDVLTTCLIQQGTHRLSIPHIFGYLWKHHTMQRLLLSLENLWWSGMISFLVSITRTKIIREILRGIILTALWNLEEKDSLWRFFDSDHMGDTLTYISRTGLIVFSNFDPVYCFWKKQPTCEMWDQNLWKWTHGNEAYHKSWWTELKTQDVGHHLSEGPTCVCLCW